MIKGAPFIHFSIPGRPVPKGRPRLGMGIVFTPKETRAYEKMIAQLAALQMRGKTMIEKTDMGCSVIVAAYLPIPESWSIKKKAAALAGLLRPTATPDVDNITKSALDAINKIIYRDDAFVTDQYVKKRYSTNPRLEVSVFINTSNITI